jgi:asparagine N-glycosylation enzyme membrane subunit Stt3
MGREAIGLMWEGSLFVCELCVSSGAMCTNALVHAVVCLRRRLSSNQISIIANGTFAGLTALTWLYGVGLWVLGYLWCFLLGTCMDVGACFPGLI